ncbi:MAG: HAMP domain-containing histidine kinase [Candidatus Kapabacteria bacterium]|nr:HAMP domain-containing histidine kinase [Candidatus Kapabacteria bacterium]
MKQAPKPTFPKMPSEATLRKRAAEQAAAGVVILALSDGETEATPAKTSILFTNTAFARILEQEQSSLLGKDVLDYTDFPHKTELATALRTVALNDTEPQVLYIAYKQSSGQQVFTHVHCKALEISTPRKNSVAHKTSKPHKTSAEHQIICTFTDVTDLVQSNESLSTEIKSLEDNMHRRTNELQEFIDEIRNELQQRGVLERELQRAEKRYRSLAENFPNGAVIMLDKQRQCLLVEGTQAERIPVQTREDSRTLAEPLASLAEALIVQAFDGKHSSLEIALGGEPYLLHAVPLAAERQAIEAVMLVCQNITDFKTRQHLEKEQEMTELKYRFVTIASHELRTPLAGMMLAAGILRRYWETTSDDEKWDALQDITRGLDRMSSLLDNILVVGKSDSGKLPFEPQDIDLVQFCRELVHEHEKSLGQTHITLATYNTESLPFLGDPKLLRLIFGNLLSNAYKYSPDTTTVRFSLRVGETEVSITVQDSGIGIPAEDLPQLFVSFHRGKNVGEIQGTGLGLAIVERSVKMHGGTITVESTVNVGTTFRVTLPLGADLSAESLSS